ncbi:MAG: hypothetical protein ACKOZU_06775 [Planctomycetaceae bacterium]
MKAPSIDLGSAGDLLLRHCEKIVAACVALVAALLIWGGVTAVRSLSVTDAQTPEAVNRVVTQARGHIDREAQAPADQLSKREPLASLIDPWRTPLVPWWTGTASAALVINPQPAVVVLDRPLFDEAAKRGRPDVLPLEDLRAVAGLAVLPVVAPPAAAVPAQPAASVKKPEAGGRPPRGGALPPPEMAPLPAGAAGQPGGIVENGRIVPYVIVTGLIPVRKQQQEYRSRFESCGYRDPKRDSPLWSDFEIERTTVGPDGKETWKKIDLPAVVAKRAAEWGAAAAAAVPLDPEFLMGPTEDARSRQTTPLPFCSPLPQRLVGDWDLADMHPWLVERLLAKRAAETQQREQAAPVEPADAGPGREGPGFEAPEERMPEPAAVAATAELPEYRLFRYVDTDVAPGVTYRYRVRLKVWNPNWDKSPERMRPHLTDPSFAIDKTLVSADSAASSDATVPDPTRVLVGTLRPEDLKELKIRTGSGTVEVLVLGPSTQTGGFALRALVADPGAVVDVDERYNGKNQRDRARGEKIVTRRLLVDARGRQEERRDAAEKGKPAPGIPEPFEVLCLRPDGSFEFASVDGSERLVEANLATLPPRSTKSDAKGPLPPDAGRGELPVEPPRPGGRL